jgi:hypothetical protein
MDGFDVPQCRTVPTAAVVSSIHCAVAVKFKVVFETFLLLLLLAAFFMPMT